MQYAYTDVTDRPDLATPYPEVVAAFEQLGWRVLGRYALELPEKAVQRLVAGYAEPARSQFLAHLPDVATVLVSPDGRADAFVSWFWDEPAVRLASVLADGTLVETSRLWPRKPPWPRSLRSGWAGMDVREEMERSSVPTRGRSIRTVASGDLADPSVLSALVDAHRAHVAERSSPALPFASLGDAIALRRKAFEHDLRVRRRAGLALGIVVLVAAVVLGLLSGILSGTIPLLRSASGVWVVVEALALMAAFAWAQGWLIRQLTYVRWIRPAYR